MVTEFQTIPSKANLFIDEHIKLMFALLFALQFAPASNQLPQFTYVWL